MKKEIGREEHEDRAGRRQMFLGKQVCDCLSTRQQELGGGRKYKNKGEENVRIIEMKRMMFSMKKRLVKMDVEEKQRSYLNQQTA